MGERWLVIDDSSTIQRVIKLAFQDYDVLISEADSCPEAMQEIAKTAPTLVIADAAVAGVQSVQDFVNLRNQAPHTPFIIIEGSYDNIDEGQFRGAGFFHFLKKPFDSSQLLVVTRQALGRALPYRQSNLPPPPPVSRAPRPLQEESSSRSMKPVDMIPGSFDLGLNDARVTQPPLSNSFALDDIEGIEITQRRETRSSTVSQVLEPMLKEELERWVKATVEDYCKKHFPALARELITRELERLTQERSRLLVDK